MTSSEWKRPALEVLLKLYREHPILYDMRHSKYYNKTERQKALTTIIDMLEEHRPGTTSNDILRKIQSMRTQFGQELNKMKRQQNKSVAYVPTVWWYNYLSFLRNHIRPRSAIEEDDYKASQQHSEGEFESYNDESVDYDGESEIIYEIQTQSTPKCKGLKTEFSSSAKLQNGNDKEEIVYEITQANTVVPKRKIELNTADEQTHKQSRTETMTDEPSIQSNSGVECRKSEICEISIDGDRCHSLGRFVTSQMASIRDDYLFYATQMDVLNIINKAQLKQLLIDKEEKMSN